jgi:hypothetical protein
MERNIRRFWDQMNSIVWFIVVVIVFIFCLAIINGYGCGYKNSLIAHGILGFIVVGCLVILMLVCFVMKKIVDFILRDKKAKK